MLDNYFLKPKTNLFKNKDVLSPDYTPDKLLCREKEIEDISGLLSPVIVNESSPSPAIIYGDTGIGKTVTIQHIFKMLQEAFDIKNIQSKPHVIFINCQISSTPTKVLYDIIKTINPSSNVPFTGLSESQYFNILWTSLKESNRPMIIIFDEIDKLKSQSILYSISRAKQTADLHMSQYVVMYAMTNNLKYEETLDPRISSSWNPTAIFFSNYNAEQLMLILEDRKDKAFFTGILDDEVIPLCAAYSAQDYGDARKAIDLLKTAGVIAQNDNKNKVDISDVKKAEAAIDSNRFKSAIKGLPLTQKMVLLAIVYHANIPTKSLTTGMVYDMYKSIAGNTGHEIRSIQRISNIISKFEMMGFINTSSAKDKKGNTRYILPDKSILPMMPIILEDEWLHEIALPMIMTTGCQKKITSPYSPF